MDAEKAALVVEGKFIRSDGCWEWTAWKNPKGYGCLSLPKPGGGQTKHFAHRVLFELYRGPIPEGLQLDHLCRNRSCVNPDHLEPVTCQENLLRGDTHAARLSTRTHCGKGHEFSPENTIIRRDGSRRCRECNKAQCQDYDRRNPRKR